MRRLLLLIVVLFAKEAHVSGGYAECFADVSALVCIESDSRKRFVDDEQARDWIGGHRQQAERRLATMVPRLRVALRAAAADGLPLAPVDDWRLPADPGEQPATTAGSLRPQVTLGTFHRQTIAVTVTTTRAIRAAERSALQAHLARALDVPAYDPDREREGIYAPSLSMSSPGPSVPPPSSSAAPVSTPPPPAPPLAVEDVRPWQPLWIAEPAVVGGVRLGIGTTMRVSTAASTTWRPWLQAQLTALRSSWSKQRCALPAGSAAPVDTVGPFTQIGGFRPWGPLLLDEDVQARVDDGLITRMARLSLPKAPQGQPGNEVYGTLSACLTAASPPLPAPPAR